MVVPVGQKKPYNHNTNSQKLKSWHLCAMLIWWETGGGGGGGNPGAEGAGSTQQLGEQRAGARFPSWQELGDTGENMQHCIIFHNDKSTMSRGGNHYTSGGREVRPCVPSPPPPPNCPWELRPQESQIYLSGWEPGPPLQTLEVKYAPISAAVEYLRQFFCFILWDFIHNGVEKTWARIFIKAVECTSILISLV